MAYTKLDRTTPAGTQNGTAVPTSARENIVAVADGLLLGHLADYALSQTVGTGTAEQPQYLFLKNGATWLRATITWGSSGGALGNMQSIVLDLSINSGSDYTTSPGGNICTITNTFDASGNLTASSGGGSLFGWLTYLLGKVKALKTAYDAHAAATGVSVHGLGTMATQAASAVNVTGGTVAGVNLDYNYARGKVVNLGNITGSVAIDWAAGDYFYGTVTGTATLSWSNRPTGKVGSVTLELTNPGAFALTWPAGVLWPGGLAPSRTASGVDLYEFVCRDGSTVRGAQAQKASA